jgi:hypothetical protein
MKSLQLFFSAAVWVLPAVFSEEPTRRRTRPKLATRPININTSGKKKRHLERIFVGDTEFDGEHAMSTPTTLPPATPAPVETPTTPAPVETPTTPAPVETAKVRIV